MSTRRVAFVLGGGGKWGAVEAGMLAALVARDVRPDLVLGCSIGAMNGAAFALDPTTTGVRRLEDWWTASATDRVITTRLRDRLHAFAGRRPALHDPSALRSLVTRALGDHTFGDTAVPFQCVAASIESAGEHWFVEGPLVDAVMASSAVPVLFPPVRIGDHHFYDGGLVNSIPLDRAIELGATEVYVLQVGRIEEPLRPPRRLHEAGLVAFEIARRHRFVSSQRSIRDGVTIHVLPSGNAMRMDDRRQLRWRSTGDAPELVERARAATDRYLTEHPPAPTRPAEDP